MSGIHVTTDGDTLWLACFHDEPDSEAGDIIRPVEPGDSWDDYGPWTVTEAPEGEAPE